MTEVQITEQARKDSVEGCNQLPDDMWSEKRKCLESVAKAKVGEVNYYTNAASAGIMRQKYGPKFDNLQSCAKMRESMALTHMVPRDADFCAKIPAAWEKECVARMLMQKPAVEYKQDMSKGQCDAAGLLFEKYPGCSTQCAVENKSFSDATGQCEWDQGFEPVEMTQTARRPAAPVRPVLPRASGAK